MHAKIFQATIGWAAVVVLAGASIATAQEAADPAAPQRHINIHVIGFDVDESTAQQLTDMAAAGGGRYYPAENETQLAAALGQAAGVSLTPVLSDEAEGNNSLGESNIVASTGVVSGTIDPQGDHDWYMIEVDRPGVLHVSITNVPADLEIIVRGYNAERSAISGWLKPLRAGGETIGTIDLHQAGKHYLEVEDNGNDAASPDAYALELRFEPGDAFEPNNSFGRASEVGPDADFYASILPKGDSDWVMFEVPRRGALSVAVTDVPPDIDVVFRAYDGNSSAISGWVAPLRAGADTLGVIDVHGTGRHYLEFRDSGDDAANPAEFHVQLQYDPGDDYEPSESIAQAAAVDPTTQLFANILPKGDHDWYVFEVDHPGISHVKIGNSPPNLDLTFRVYNRERSAITGWFAPLRVGAENVAIVDLPITGRYYLELVDGRDDERSAQQYSLELEYVRADRYESNNSFGRAADIAVGQPVQGSILPKGDHDWYAFEVGQQGEYEVAVTNVPLDLDIHYRLYNANAGALSGWVAPLRAGADTVEKLKIPASGRYLLEVVDGGDDARSEEKYTLTVSPASGSQTP